MANQPQPGPARYASICYMKQIRHILEQPASRWSGGHIPSGGMYDRWSGVMQHAMCIITRTHARMSHFAPPTATTTPSRSWPTSHTATNTCMVYTVFKGGIGHVQIRCVGRWPQPHLRWMSRWSGVMQHAMCIITHITRFATTTPSRSWPTTEILVKYMLATPNELGVKWPCLRYACQ